MRPPGRHSLNRKLGVTRRLEMITSALGHARGIAASVCTPPCLPGERLSGGTMTSTNTRTPAAPSGRQQQRAQLAGAPALASARLPPRPRWRRLAPCPRARWVDGWASQAYVRVQPGVRGLRMAAGLPRTCMPCPCHKLCILTHACNCTHPAAGGGAHWGGRHAAGGPAGALEDHRGALVAPCFALLHSCCKIAATGGGGGVAALKRPLRVRLAAL